MNKKEFSGKQCLIVEDRRPFLMLLKGLFTNLGVKSIRTELSAEDAVKACKLNHFDIIVSDLHLGTNRKNGFEFLEEVRKLQLIKPTTVFVMISGDSARSVVLGSIEKQPDDFLVKPFSQAQLNARISRALVKRALLNPLYELIDKSLYEEAVECCIELIKQHSRYAASLTHMLIELYWKTSKLDQAEQILDKMLGTRKLTWSLCALARTYLLQERFEDAIDAANEAIDLSSNCVDAFDIRAEALLKLDNKPEALKSITEALSIAPLSIDRHFKVCEIARENEDFELAVNSSKAIYDLSKRSVHKNVNHMCGYIRSMLDAAEYASDRSTKNKFMQESGLALQKARTDEVVRNSSTDFDFDIFSNIIGARLLYIEGKVFDAKKVLEETQVDIEKKFDNYPVSMAPDSFKVMLDLCDFEEALKLSEVMHQQSDQIDQSILYLMENETNKIADERKKYIRHNKKGIELYGSGQYAKAYEEFSIAKNIAHLNIGVTLNLLQCSVKLLIQNNKSDPKMMKETKEMFRFIENMPLKSVYKTKFQSIKEEWHEAGQ